MRNFQYRALSRSTTSPKVIVTKGKHKGLVALVKNCWNTSSITLEVEPEIYVPYENCEFVDETGNPIIVPVTDMTGREIVDGTWVIYSVGGGKNPHGLEIGKVETVSPKGGLRVQRFLRDGKKVDGSFRFTEFYNIPDANRTVALPVNEVDMMEWVLKDFEGLK